MDDDQPFFKMTTAILALIFLCWLSAMIIKLGL